MMSDLRQARRVTPLVRFVRQGGPGDELFNSLLVDEPAAGAAGGLPHFLGQVEQEVTAQLRADLRVQEQ
jgi:hypothetical protein